MRLIGAIVIAFFIAILLVTLYISERTKVEMIDVDPAAVDSGHAGHSGHR